MMVKRSRMPRDMNQLAHRVVELATTDAGREEEFSAGMTLSEAAAAMGRMGGLKGGPARAKKLSATRRKAIARKAAKTRWNKRNP